MESAETSPPHASLGDTLRRVLDSDHPGGPSIREIAETVGEKGFGLLLLVLALPSALPVPAPGYSTPFGIVIALVAAQMLAGREAVWLPRKLGDARIRPETARKLLRSAEGLLRRLERLVRPRHRWIRSRPGRCALSCVIGLMGGLMIFPIPLTNTAPAMVVFLIGVGLSEEDGLLALGAFAVGCLAVLLYAGVIYLLITRGPEAVAEIKEALRGLLGGAAD